MGKTKEDMTEIIENLDYAKKVGIDTDCSPGTLALRIMEYKLERIKLIKDFTDSEYDY